MAGATVNRLSKLIWIVWLGGCDPSTAEATEAILAVAVIEVQLSPTIFGAQDLGEESAGLSPYDEAWIQLEQADNGVPEQWQYSAGETAGGTFGVVPWYQVLVHPSAVYSITQMVRVPSYVCALVTQWPQHQLQQGVRAASSNCAPVPPGFTGDYTNPGVEVPQTRVVEQPIQILVDAVGGYHVFGDSLVF